MLIEKFSKFINTPVFLSLFAAISSDPLPANSWADLYNNIYFRFIFIFIVVCQTNNDIKSAIMITVATMIFFYSISSKEEKENILSDNKNPDDLKTFLYFCIFVVVTSYIF